MVWQQNRWLILAEGEFYETGTCFEKYLTQNHGKNNYGSRPPGRGCFPPYENGDQPSDPPDLSDSDLSQVVVID